MSFFLRQLERRRQPFFASSPFLAGERGIALVVVIIVLVILYLVVFQMRYTTKLEEELAEVRMTESAGSFAIASVASYVLSILAEDAKADQAKMSEAGMSGLAGGGGLAGGEGAPRQGQGGLGGGGLNLPAGTSLPPGVTEEQVRQMLGNSQGGDDAASGDDPDAAAALAGLAGGGASTQSSGTLDYLLENIFQPNVQSINGVEVKIKIIDNEGRYNLNRLWEYVRIRVEGLTEEQRVAQFEEARRQVEEVALQQVDPATGDDLALNASDEQWVPPSEEQRELVREMLTRAIDLMMRMNDETGFVYRMGLPQPESLAVLIEDFCYQRRSQPVQNRVSLVSELLAFPEVTPELFYGPIPHIPDGEEFRDAWDEFIYTKDEFGDLVATYIPTADMFLQEQAYQRERLAELQDQFGAFGAFPELGGRLANPLTRNMTELAENFDQTGLAVPPMPLGLRDLFCTISRGKININTAPAPILFGLMQSLDPIDAETVAFHIERYRTEYQEIMSEEEMDGEFAAAETQAEAGCERPKRELPPETDEFGNPIGESGNFLEDEMLEEISQSSTYQDYETNYFTNLCQLIYVDGEDGSAEDLLRQEGVERIDESYQSPLELVTHDLEETVVFGSTYFTARLKIKAGDSPVIKAGDLVVHRDMANNRMEVLQWKRYQR